MSPISTKQQKVKTGWSTYYICIVVGRFHYQRGRFGISLTGITPPQLYARPKPRPALPTAYVVVFFVYSAFKRTIHIDDASVLKVDKLIQLFCTSFKINTIQFDNNIMSYYARSNSGNLITALFLCPIPVYVILKLFINVWCGKSTNVQTL
jgi:hypothetical protein